MGGIERKGVHWRLGLREQGTLWGGILAQSIWGIGFVWPIS